MDTERLKTLMEKVAKGEGSAQEKFDALQGLNALIEDYNKAVEEALKQNPE